MSSQVFPSLPGLDIAVKRTQSHATLVQTAASGKEQRASFRSGRPRYSYSLTFNFLRQSGFSRNTVYDELAKLSQFMADMKGRFDSFLFTDPVASTVTGKAFGTGDGTTVAFQLVDPLGAPIYDLNGIASIYVAGALKTLTTDYTISSTGLVTFVSAPASAAAIAWSGAFYRRCRFDADELELERLVKLAWSGEDIKIASVVL